MSLIQDALKRKTEEAGPPEAQAPHPFEAEPRRPEPNPTDPPPVIDAPPPFQRPRRRGLLPVELILILLLIGSYVYFFVSRRREAAPPVSEEEVRTEKKTLAPNMKSNPRSMPVLTDQPVAEAVVPKEEKKPQQAEGPNDTHWPDLTFSGTAASGNEVLAVINGRMLSAGESIEGVKILKIGKSLVMVDYQGEKRVLRIGSK